jgi:hypothetical protein
MVFKDIENRELKIGDVIIIPKYSNLSKHLVLGFTEKHVIVSCFMKHYQNYRPEKGYRTCNNNISEHDDRYYNHKYSQFYIVERNFDIPEHLRKFVKYNQL